jgi:environmental stress-induced protein Ves
VAPGPFSDYSGYDRVQVLVKGSGLVLEAPAGEIDVRAPFRPVRFDGGATIASRLEAGPVEVVNLIGRRDAVKIDMTVRDTGQTQPLAAGIDFAYAASGPVTLMVDGQSHALAPDHCLRIDSGNRTILAVMSGRVIVASISPV